MAQPENSCHSWQLIFSTENTLRQQPSQEFCEGCSLLSESCHCGMDIELGRKTSFKEKSRQQDRQCCVPDWRGTGVFCTLKIHGFRQMTRTFCEIALVQNCEMKSWISRVNAVYVHPCLQNKVTFNLFWPGVFLPPKVFWISRTPSLDVTQQCLICSTDHLRVFGSHSAVSWPSFIWSSIGMCCHFSLFQKIWSSPSAYQDVRIY